MYYLPIYHVDKTESVEEFKSRVKVFSIAVDLVCIEAVNRKFWPNKKMCITGLYTLADFESSFLKRIQEHKCRKYECDPDPVTKEPRAISYWQIHRRENESKEEWLQLSGLNIENVTKAAWRACTTLTAAFRYCKTHEGMFSLYGTGRTCFNKLGEKRKEKLFKNLNLIKEWEDE